MKNKGILLAISSLPGNHGIGDFGDAAYRFIDFLSDHGFNYWQILPINPLGPGWSPYTTTCSEAIEYRYICLDYLKKEGWITKLDKYSANSKIARYEKAGEFKEKVLRKAYKAFITKRPRGLKRFMEENPWVIKYATFMIFWNKNDKKPWNEWPKEEKFYFDKHKTYPTTYKDEVLYLVFTQFIAYKQWNKLMNYAHKKDVSIIGDIPFYVGYSSTDCWINRKYFNLDDNFIPTKIAGCPPDAFSETGQLWGNPTYNFDKLKEDNYSFLINRIKSVFKLCDVLRLDHFRAFYSYYSIPGGAKDAKIGEWVLTPGYEIFDELFRQLPGAKIIAEDLGFMTQEVYDLRDHYHFPGMNVLQFTTFDNNFRDNGDMVVYSGTHDNETLRSWFESLSDHERGVIAWNIHADPNKELLPQFLEYALNKPARLNIIPLTDYLLLDNSVRFNTPGTVGSPNWEWKLTKLPK